MNGRLEFTQNILRSKDQVCSLNDFYRTAHSNSRNDVSTLRQRGWEIDAWWTRHDDGPAHSHYSLRSAPSRSLAAHSVFKNSR